MLIFTILLPLVLAQQCPTQRNNDINCGNKASQCCGVLLNCGGNTRSSYSNYCFSPPSGTNQASSGYEYFPSGSTLATSCYQSCYSYSDLSKKLPTQSTICAQDSDCSEYSNYCCGGVFQSNNITVNANSISTYSPYYSYRYSGYSYQFKSIYYCVSPDFSNYYLTYQTSPNSLWTATTFQTWCASALFLSCSLTTILSLLLY